MVSFESLKTKISSDSGQIPQLCVIYYADLLFEKKISDKIKKDHSNIIFELEIKIKNRDKTLIKSVAWFFFFKKKNF